MINRNMLLKKFANSENKIFVSKIIDKIELSIKRHQIVFTDFINPSERVILIDLLKCIIGLKYDLFGGFCECERSIVCFYPEYMEVLECNFPIKAIKITRSIKFSGDISHRDYLGSILGLGINRDKIGDILVFDDYSVCFVHENIANYISSNLLKVGRTPVDANILDIKDVDIPKKNLLEKKSTVASLRLDAIISSALNISRAKSQDFIKSKKVNIDWSIITDLSYTVNEGNVISVRGKGRFVVSQILKKTKKDRIVIVFSLYI